MGALRLRSLPGASIAIALATAVLLDASPARAAICSSSAECDGGPCVDGFCCDTACTDPCEGCSAAVKGGGLDGVCGQAAAGKICKPYQCGDPGLMYTGPSVCDVAGNCIAPQPVQCAHDNPCKLDLCSDLGCEIVIKTDGTGCGGGMACIDGMCGSSTSSSSSSSGSSTSSTSSTSGGGAGGSGSGGSGGAKTESSGGDPYPPAHPTCGCRVAGDAPAGSAIAAAIAAIALRYRRRASARG